MEPVAAVAFTHVVCIHYQITTSKLYALAHLSLFPDHPPISTTLLVGCFPHKSTTPWILRTCPHVDILYFELVAISSALTFCEFGKQSVKTKRYSPSPDVTVKIYFIHIFIVVSGKTRNDVIFRKKKRAGARSNVKREPNAGRRA